MADERTVRERHRGYAFRQVKGVRDKMVSTLERDRDRLSPGEVERAEARIADYNDLITACEALKQAIN